jgi:hypothetical protein
LLCFCLVWFYFFAVDQFIYSFCWSNDWRPFRSEFEVFFFQKAWTEKSHLHFTMLTKKVNSKNLCLPNIESCCCSLLNSLFLSCCIEKPEYLFISFKFSIEGFSLSLPPFYSSFGFWIKLFPSHSDPFIQKRDFILVSLKKRKKEKKEKRKMQHFGWPRKWSGPLWSRLQKYIQHLKTNWVLH